ncbi:hypothetical protein EDD85DRAFT_939901 [Armillaria nabsnona]|nr:hypothetical protein EDD85DRAFT_939901 [Armillaria nabsnona]
MATDRQGRSLAPLTSPSATKAPNFLDKNEFDLRIEGQSGPKGAVKYTARFNRLTSGFVDSSRLRGVIVAGMKNTELVLWDPVRIIAGVGSSDSLILRNTNHTGPVRALNFNPLQTHFLSSGAINGEPGSDPDQITSVSWNQQDHTFLPGRARRATLLSEISEGNVTSSLWRTVVEPEHLQAKSPRRMALLLAIRLVNTSEDDSSPIIMVWDLHNARTPEKIGAQLEPPTSEIIGELPSASNCMFEVEWCPCNPDLLAPAFFDNTVRIHSIQSIYEPTASAIPATAGNGADIFNSTGYSQTQGSTLSLKQPQKWNPSTSDFRVSVDLMFGSAPEESKYMECVGDRAEATVLVMAKFKNEQLDEIMTAWSLMLAFSVSWPEEVVVQCAGQRLRVISERDMYRFMSWFNMGLRKGRQGDDVSQNDGSAAVPGFFLDLRYLDYSLSVALPSICLN